MIASEQRRCGVVRKNEQRRVIAFSESTEISDVRTEKHRPEGALRERCRKLYAPYFPTVSDLDLGREDKAEELNTHCSLRLDS